MAFHVGALTATLGFEIPGVDRREAELYEKKLDEFQRRTAKRDAFKAHLGANYDGRAFNAMERDLRRNEKTTDDNVRAQGRLRTAFGTVYGRGGALFAAAGGLYALQAAGKAVVGTATDINESLTKNQTLFGQYAQTVDRWSKATANSLGISRAAALAAAGSFGSLFETIGTADKPAADMSRRLVRLAADLASFNNASPEETLEALRSGLIGEAEPMRRFGVLLSETRVKAEAYASGIAKAGSELTEQQKVQARYQLILKDSGQAQGDFAKTSGGLANQTRILKAQLSDIGGELGTRLLPAVTDAARALNRFLRQVESGTGAGGDFVDTLEAIWRAARYVGREIGDMVEGLRLMTLGVLEVLEPIAVVSDKLGPLGGAFGDMRDEIHQAKETLETMGRAGHDFEMEDVRYENRKTGQSFKDMADDGKVSLREIARTTRQRSQEIREDLGKNSREGREALAENFRKAADAVDRQMKRGDKVTRAGMQAIRSYLVEELQVYGLSLSQARNIAKTGDPDANRGREGGALRQQGGWLGARGMVGSDSIEVSPGYWAAPGEFYAKGPAGRGAVINRHQAPIVDLALMRGGHTLDTLPRDSSALPRIEAALRDFGGLDAVFSSIQRPHMLQGGGIVELLHPGNDPRGHGDHLHIGGVSSAVVVAIGRMLQKLGWLVGEHPAFGPVGRHVAGSLHYDNRAIDVNWPDAGAERAKIAALLPMLGSGQLAPARPVPRQRITGGGAVGRAVQGALDIARGGAQRVLNRASAPTATMASGGGSADANRALARRLLGSFGWGPDQFGPLDALWMGESGWNENAVNPSSGAGGIPQALPASKMGPGWQGNALQQIRWGLGYIKGRYGTPSAAYSAWQSRSPHWYQRGGNIAQGVGRAPGSGRGRTRPATRRHRPPSASGLGRRQDIKNLIAFAEIAEQKIELASLTPSIDDDLYWLRFAENAYSSIIAKAPQATAAQYVSNLTGVRQEIADLLAPPVVDTPPGSEVTEVIRPPSPEEIAQGVAAQLASFIAARASLFSAYGSNFTLAGQPLVPNTAAGLMHFGGGSSGGQAPAQTKVINQTNIFPTPPPDPHLFARGTLHDLQAAP